MSSTPPRRSDAAPPPRSYSRTLWRLFLVAAILIALLPFPVTTFGLLPSYRVQGRFLAFYAPFICLLSLAYLIYLRDRLARRLFASVLDPLPSPDPYYASRRQRVAYLAATLRGAFMTALPALLVIASVCCAMRYRHRLSESVALVGEDVVLPDTAEHELAYLGAGVGTSPDSHDDPDSGAVTLPVDAAGVMSASTRVRILQTTGIDDIPLFGELSVLYIGVFVTALGAMALMALREYAKEAMGLSEEDLILGGRPAAEDQGA